MDGDCSFAAFRRIDPPLEEDEAVRNDRFRAAEKAVAGLFR
jgi:hypothetical protein